MPEGGNLTLRVKQDAEHAVIEVTDTGSGMSEEVRARCLEPFFSTKGAAGTGLGLAMVHGIVRRHDGKLEIDSFEGLGTTFRIILPFCSEAAEQRQVEESPERQRPLRIFFAEDDPGLRQIIPEHLAADGHSVEVACDGREALTKVSGGAFDLLVTDLSMPRMNGEDLAAAVRRESPGTRIIMLTGFGSMLVDEDGSQENVDLLLSKPITHKILSSAIAQVSGRGDQTRITAG
jgi:CheY-like chemotaxis protein